MNPQQPSPSEPSKADKDWYNEASMYVGFYKPVVEHVDESELDYLNIDDQGYDQFKENE